MVVLKKGAVTHRVFSAQAAQAAQAAQGLGVRAAATKR